MNVYNQGELPLDDPRQPNPALIKFHDYLAKHPAILAGMIAEARIAVAAFGAWHAHLALDTLRLRTGASASRSFAPAFARLIEAECPDLRGKIATRPSKFGR